MKYLPILLLSGCTSMMPMTDSHTVDQFSDADVKRVMKNTGLSEADVRDPTIKEVYEQKESCWEMLKVCYPGVNPLMKALGSFPLACTEIWQYPWREKKAVIHYCWATDPITMAHERKHASGNGGHKYW